MHAERLLYHTCTNFVVDSSSHFPFRARANRLTDRQTNRRTRLNALPTPAAMPAWVTRKQQRKQNTSTAYNVLKICNTEVEYNAESVMHSHYDARKNNATAIWPVLISHPAESRRLSWPEWPRSYIREQSPIFQY